MTQSASKSITNLNNPNHKKKNPNLKSSFTRNDLKFKLT